MKKWRNKTVAQIRPNWQTVARVIRYSSTVVQVETSKFIGSLGEELNFCFLKVTTDLGRHIKWCNYDIYSQVCFFFKDYHFIGGFINTNVSISNASPQVKWPQLKMHLMPGSLSFLLALQGQKNRQITNNKETCSPLPITIYRITKMSQGGTHIISLPGNKGPRIPKWWNLTKKIQSNQLESFLRMFYN